MRPDQSTSPDAWRLLRLASYVPGELIPLPLSGSIPELPHVARVGCGRWMPFSYSARNGPPAMSAVWSLSGGKRTRRLRAPTSEFDPSPTSPLRHPGYAHALINAFAGGVAKAPR